MDDSQKSVRKNYYNELFINEVLRKTLLPVSLYKASQMQVHILSSVCTPTPSVMPSLV